MKKFFVAASIALLLCSTVFAQVTVGVRGGLSTNLGTKLTGEFGTALDEALKYQAEAQDWDYSKPVMLGADVGIYAKVAVFDSVFIQPEVNYNMTNGMTLKISGTEPSSGTHVTQIMGFEFSTVDIPVLLGYSLKAGPVVVSPFVGPQLSLIQGKMKTYNKVNDEEIPGDDEVISTSSYGVVAGCGVSYPVTDAIDVGLDIRYAIDLSAITITQGDATSDMLSRRGLSVNASVGYKF